MTRHPPKAVVHEDEGIDPWRLLRKKPGIKVLDTAKYSPGPQ